MGTVLVLRHHHEELQHVLYKALKSADEAGKEVRNTLFVPISVTDLMDFLGIIKLQMAPSISLDAT